MKTRARKILLTLLIALSFSALAQAEVYVVKGKRGVITFTSRKPEGQDFEIFKPAHYPISRFRSWGTTNWTGVPRLSDFDKMIQFAALEHSLDPALVKAVVHVESAFNPSARSRMGAMGLMQLMPGTARRFGVWNAYAPEQNLKGGTKYLRWLLDRYKGDERKAVAAYNAGEGAVDDYGTVPPYSETQTYVKRVAQMASAYRNFVSKKS